MKHGGTHLVYRMDVIWMRFGRNLKEELNFESKTASGQEQVGALLRKTLCPERIAASSSEERTEEIYADHV